MGKIEGNDTSTNIFNDDMLFKIFDNNNIMVFNYKYLHGYYCKDRLIGALSKGVKNLITYDDMNKFINHYGKFRHEKYCYRCGSERRLPFTDCEKCSAPYIKKIPLEKYYCIKVVGGYKFYFDRKEFEIDE